MRCEMSLLEISSLYKQFADTLALDNVSLAIEEGEPVENSCRGRIEFSRFH
jgi:hypothetical protein